MAPPTRRRRRGDRPGGDSPNGYGHGRRNGPCSLSRKWLVQGERTPKSRGAWGRLPPRLGEDRAWGNPRGHQCPGVSRVACFLVGPAIDEMLFCDTGLTCTIPSGESSGTCG